MFGVVLWSDQTRDRAVIWCEDHGDLAFFDGVGAESLEGADLDPGDLVQIDVREERQLRVAFNPRIVASDEYPTLARDLRQAGTEPAVAPIALPVAGNAKIIAFKPKSDKIEPVEKRALQVI